MKKSSTPMIPIQMTREGDYLTEYPSFIPDHHTDEFNEADDCIGFHDVCSGFVDRKITTQDGGGVILCRSCSLRIYVPKSIITYGDLRKYLHDLWK